MKTELTLNVLQTMSAQEYEDIRAAGSDERRELTHAVMRELDAPDNWTMNLGFISDVDEILHFSELGVVFLMFIIGLELNPSKLWQLRRSIFGVGAAQVLLSAALLAGLQAV